MAKTVLALGITCGKGGRRHITEHIARKDKKENIE